MNIDVEKKLNVTVKLKSVRERTIVIVYIYCVKQKKTETSSRNCKGLGRVPSVFVSLLIRGYNSSVAIVDTPASGTV